MNAVPGCKVSDQCREVSRAIAEGQNRGLAVIDQHRLIGQSKRVVEREKLLPSLVNPADVQRAQLWVMKGVIDHEVPTLVQFGQTMTGVTVKMTSHASPRSDLAMLSCIANGDGGGDACLTQRTN